MRITKRNGEIIDGIVRDLSLIHISYTVPYWLVVAGIDIGMVVHQYIFRWYPSGIIDFTVFFKVPLAVIQETYNRLGLACNVRVGLNEFVGSVLFTYL